MKIYKKLGIYLMLTVVSLNAVSPMINATEPVTNLVPNATTTETPEDTPQENPTATNNPASPVVNIGEIGSGGDSGISDVWDDPSSGSSSGVVGAIEAGITVGTENGGSGGGGSSVGYTYDETYNYTEALIDSYTAGQFVLPLGGTLRNVLLDDNVKSSLGGLYNSKTTMNYAINYRDLWYKDESDNWHPAQLKDLFNIDNSGAGKILYVKYTVLELNDMGEWVPVKRCKPVFHTNPYSFYYVNLAVQMSENSASVLMQNTESYIQMDQYGNIVINNGSLASSSTSSATGNSDTNHFMVIPNFANPDLNKNSEYYLANRLYISMYTSRALNTVQGYEDVQGSGIMMPYDEFKDTVGKSNGQSGIATYILPESNGVSYGDLFSLQDITKIFVNPQITVPYIIEANLTNYSITDSWKKFMNARLDVLNMGKGFKIDDPEDYDKMDTLFTETYGDTSDISRMLLTSYGGTYTKYFYNFFHSDSVPYLNLGDIGETGIGKTNSSFSLLPQSNINYGSGSIAFSEHTVKLEGSIEGDNCRNWCFLNHNLLNIAPDLLNTGMSWNTEVSAEELALFDTALSSFAPNEQIVFDDKDDSNIFNVIAYLADDIVEVPDDISSTNAINPEANIDKKNTTVLDIIYHYLTNIGSSQVAINTSKASVWYTTLLNTVDENYLFHVKNILSNDFVVSAISRYFSCVMTINFIWIIFLIFKYYGPEKTLPTDTFLKIIFTLIISVMPYCTVLYYSEASELITQKFFKETFNFWSLTNIDRVSKESEAQKEYATNQQAYFREKGIKSVGNYGSVEIYGSRIGIIKEEESKDFEVLDNILLGKTGDIDFITSTASVRDILDQTDKSGDITGASCMSNTDKYSESIFFYFYDMLKYRYANYCNSMGISPAYGFGTPEGMVNSYGNVTKMFSNPYFLYGPDYDSALTNSGAEAQDIVGLTNLFSIQGDSYFSYISDSEWYKILRSNDIVVEDRIRGSKEYLDSTNPNNYDNGMIFGSIHSTQVESDFTVFEMALQEVNNNCAISLQKLNDYNYCSDESILFTGAMLCTMEFNSVMNHRMKPYEDLVPTTYETSSYSLDTIFCAMFLETSEDYKKYQGDLMWAVENKGGVIIQGTILITTFIGQLSGLVSLIALMLVFFAAIFAFVVAFSIKKDFSNKAWLGLMFIIICLLLTHLAFVLLIKWLCIPSTSIVQTSLFKGYTNGIRTILLLILLLLRTLALALILIFMFKHIGDLGGQIVFNGISDITGRINDFRGNVSGKVNNLKSKCTLANLQASALNMIDSIAQSEYGGDTLTAETNVDAARIKAEEGIKSDASSISDTVVDKRIEDDNSSPTSTEKESQTAAIKEDIESEIAATTDSSSISNAEETVEVLPYDVSPEETSESLTVGESKENTTNSSITNTEGISSSNTSTGTINAETISADTNTSGTNTTENSTTNSINSSISTAETSNTDTSNADSNSNNSTHNSTNNNDLNTNNSSINDTQASESTNYNRSRNEYSSNTQNQNISNSGTSNTYSTSNSVSNTTTTNDNSRSTVNNNTASNTSVQNTTNNSLQEQLNRLINLNASTGESISVENNNIFSNEHTSDGR